MKPILTFLSIMNCSNDYSSLNLDEDLNIISQFPTQHRQFTTSDTELSCNNMAGNIYQDRIPSTSNYHPLKNLHSNNSKDTDCVSSGGNDMNCKSSCSPDLDFPMEDITLSPNQSENCEYNQQFLWGTDHMSIDRCELTKNTTDLSFNEQKQPLDETLEMIIDEYWKEMDFSDRGMHTFINQLNEQGNIITTDSSYSFNSNLKIDHNTIEQVVEKVHINSLKVSNTPECSKNQTFKTTHSPSYNTTVLNQLQSTVESVDQNEYLTKDSVHNNFHPEKHPRFLNSQENTGNEQNNLLSGNINLKEFVFLSTKTRIDILQIMNEKKFNLINILECSTIILKSIVKIFQNFCRFKSIPINIDNYFKDIKNFDDFNIALNNLKEVIVNYNVPLRTSTRNIIKPDKIFIKDIKLESYQTSFSAHKYLSKNTNFPIRELFNELVFHCKTNFTFRSNGMFLILFYFYSDNQTNDLNYDYLISKLILMISVCKKKLQLSHDFDSTVFFETNFLFYFSIFYKDSKAYRFRNRFNRWIEHFTIEKKDKLSNDNLLELFLLIIFTENGKESNEFTYIQKDLNGQIDPEEDEITKLDTNFFFNSLSIMSPINNFLTEYLLAHSKDNDLSLIDITYF